MFDASNICVSRSVCYGWLSVTRSLAPNYIVKLTLFKNFLTKFIITIIISP